MSVRKRNVDKSGTVESPTVMQTLSKAFVAKSAWEDKDEFLDVVYWMRQILGVIIGLVWGIVPIKGLIGLLLFLAVNTIIVYVYFSMFQSVDEDEYGGMSEILKEGLMTSFATFLVTWIIIYSALHGYND